MIFTKKEELPVVEKIEADKMHIASFVGMERADIVYFLGKLLEQYHTEVGYRSVLLVDNSCTKDLFEIFHQVTDEEEYTVNRITVVKDIDYSEDYFNQFSFVLIYHGMDVDKNILNKSDLVVAMTDYLPATAKQLVGVFDEYSGDVQLIFRDWAAKKIKESTIEEIMQIPKEKIEMRSIIKMNPSDYIAYLMLSYNGNQKLNKSGLSELFIETLRYLAEKMTGVDEKTMQNLFKRAK